MKQKLVLFLALFLPLSAHAGEAKVKLWAEIPFLSAGNFNEFQNVMRRTRDDTRKMLWDEFGSLYLPSVMSGADAEYAARALSQVLISFDRMHDEHVAKAKQGIPEALERLLIAHFDSLYQQLGLSDDERRAVFTRMAGWNEALLKMRGGALSPEDRARIYREWLDGVDYLLYGSYTVLSGGRVALTLTLESYRTGDTKTLLAKGPVEEAVAQLADALFDLLQKNKYPGWNNPLPKLEWLVPAESLMGKTLPREARLYCQGQNARLPYARELVLASQGGSYRNGGIPAIGDSDIYLVADLHRVVENYFYFGKNRTGDDPRGPVRSDAGYGRIYPRFVCVRGDVSEVVRAEQDLYRALRGLATSPLTQEDRARAEAALEFLLIRMDAYETRYWFERKFQTSSEAIRALSSLGYEFSDALRGQLIE